MSEVTITPWPLDFDYYCVHVGRVQVGCIMNDANNLSYFHAFKTFSRVSSYANAQVLALTKEKVTLLNVTRRLML